MQENEMPEAAHPLPGGGWVVLRNVDDVTDRQRRPITVLSAKMSASGMSARIASAGDDVASVIDEDMITLMSELNDAVAAAMIDRWSYSFPVGLDTIQDLPGRAYDEVRSLTAPFVIELLPSFGPTVDPESPTVPSQP